jgi:hypothetical protein
LLQIGERLDASVRFAVGMGERAYHIPWLSLVVGTRWKAEIARKRPK